MMAILQTRPSPLYIFDEIDSAMDMSHTSKMSVASLPEFYVFDADGRSLFRGQLFGKRFKGAQFVRPRPSERRSILSLLYLALCQIVVSLKEGLFSGANVLFQAKFRDGTSIVEVGIKGWTCF
jgi:structural maintenance of chromosome 2